MKLEPRQVMFLKEEMKRVENDSERLPTERTEAGIIRKLAEKALTE